MILIGMFLAKRNYYAETKKISVITVNIICMFSLTEFKRERK